MCIFVLMLIFCTANDVVGNYLCLSEAASPLWRHLLQLSVLYVVRRIRARVLIIL